MHSNLYTRDGVTGAYGCMFTIRHLVSRAQVGVVLYGLLVLVTVFELPLLGAEEVVDGIVEGVVDGVPFCFFVQFLLHVWEQRLDSHRGQSICRICPLSFLLRPMLLHRQLERDVVR